MFVLIVGDEDKYQDLVDVLLNIFIFVFVISELKIVFQIGFMLFIFFLIIDLVVVFILMVMGMMMLLFMIVLLFFKFMLFVLVDGWNLIFGMLVISFGMGVQEKVMLLEVFVEILCEFMFMVILLVFVVIVFSLIVGFIVVVFQVVMFINE